MTPEEIIHTKLRRAALIGQKHGITEPGGCFTVGEVTMTLETNGYTIVPIDPTDEMYAAGRAMLDADMSVTDIWDAMLAAKP